MVKQFVALNAFVIGALLLLYFAFSVLAHHLVYLPYVPNTPLMQQVISQQEYYYCLDSRAEAYPNFASQVSDVNREYEARTGIRSIRVAYSDPRCQVRHVMLPEFPCGAQASACVTYANWPVDIHYQELRGYVDWRSAIGHELGHALLGLHEQYIDTGSNIGCTGRQDTVMDCGSGVRYPQPLDIERAAVNFPSWFGAACQPLTWQDVNKFMFDDCAEWWRFADASAYDVNAAPTWTAGEAQWYFRDRPLWSAPTSWGARQNLQTGWFEICGNRVYWPEEQAHLRTPRC